MRTKSERNSITFSLIVMLGVIALVRTVMADMKPSWILPVVSGGVISLESLRGQAVVVSFDAT